MKNIGIVCEGPTDYVLLKGIIDLITGEDNHYLALQPEDDLTGQYGNGWKGKVDPLVCEHIKKNDCPVKLPCGTHEESIQAYIDHLTQSIYSWLKYKDGICIVIPCDSTDAWVAAAYDELPDIELIEDPWMSIISKGKEYQGVRIPGHKKRVRIYRQFAEQVCDNWNNVKRLCISAKQFENKIKAYN